MLHLNLSRVKSIHTTQNYNSMHSADTCFLLIHLVFHLNSQLSNLMSSYNLQLTANNQHWFRMSSRKLITHFVASKKRSGLTFWASCCRLVPLCFRLFSIFTFVDSSHFSSGQKVSQSLLRSAPSLASQALASLVLF